MNAIIARYGWKTIVGTVLLTAGQLAPTIPWLAPYAIMISVAGTGLGGIGVIHKFDKLASAILAAPATQEIPHA